MKLRWLLILVIFLAGCGSKHDYTSPPWSPEVPVRRAVQWMPISEKAGAAWGVNPQLTTVIIAIELGGNPAVVSKSGVVRLMQLKPSTPGRDIYRRIGWRDESPVNELKNPERSISMGAACLSILENGPLAGIKDPQVMCYAAVVSYANGTDTLLRIFSPDCQDAIDEISGLDADEFSEHMVKEHPAPQAPHYIWKLRKMSDAMWAYAHPADLAG